MTFHVKQRILLFGLLPAEGDITSLRIVRKLREQLSLTEEENKNLGIRQNGGTFHWNLEADQPKDIEVGEKARALIIAALQQLNDQGKLTDDHIDLWDQFIPDLTGDS